MNVAELKPGDLVQTLVQMSAAAATMDGEDGQQMGFPWIMVPTVVTVAMKVEARTVDDAAAGTFDFVRIHLRYSA
jgi:hypothetical protein